jgi:hypothetical protein
LLAQIADHVADLLSGAPPLRLGSSLVICIFASFWQVPSPFDKARYMPAVSGLGAVKGQQSLA